MLFDPACTAPESNAVGAKLGLIRLWQHWLLPSDYRYVTYRIDCRGSWKDPDWKDPDGAAARPIQQSYYGTYL